ncbi:8-oxo-dGTP diphosphatase [Treponema bryantii]|uniref:NUDIX hydrolase n=1 Tax=Treponema bryantii TaxID=163 RepID=UPI002B2D9F36|nr:7,8-dihydro-8-oxoguanine triphosphatase [Treponema bryantii]
MKTLVNTTLCYIEKDGCYLMLHRTKKQNDYNHDKWIGIGGKFENGESPEDCVRREIHEETGLIVNPEDLEYCGIVTFVDKSEEDKVGEATPSLQPAPQSSTTPPAGDTPASPPYYTEFMHVFRVRKFSGTLLTDCNEGELEWVPIEKINDLPHWQADEIYLDFIAQNRPFFSLKAVYKNSRLIETYLGGKPYNHWAKD